MVSLVNMLEGLLDVDLSDKLDKNVIPKFATWIIDVWKNEHMIIGSSHEYKSCWVPSNGNGKGTFDIFIENLKRNARGCKITSKEAKRIISDKEDNIIITASLGRNLVPWMVTLTAVKRAQALEIKYSRGPFDVDWNHQIDMVSIKDPEIWGKELSNGDLYWSVFGYGRCKHEYYMLPGSCWRSIKENILR